MITTQEIQIDPEFRALIPPLRPEEREQLEANLKADGCRDPLIVWKEGRVLLDGHNRFEICTELNLPFKVVEIKLANREAAADWIDTISLGRRNLLPDQFTLLLGRRYNRLLEIERRGGDHRSADQSGQIVHIGRTEEVLAKKHGVNPKTVRRAGKFVKAVETLKEVDPEIETKVTRGKAPAKGAVVAAAEVVKKARAKPTRQVREAAEVLEKAKDEATAILKGEKGTVAQVKREVARREKREALQAKAAEVKAAQTSDVPPSWEIRQADVLEGLASVEAGTVRLVFADPPYNIGVDYGNGVEADSRPDVDYLDWCYSWIRASIKTLTPDGSMWVLIGDEYADEIGCILRHSGLHRRAWIKWYESFGVNNANNFNRCSRHLFYMVQDQDRFVFDRDAVCRPSDRQAKYNDSRADPGGKVWDDVWGINPPIPRLVGNAKEHIPDFPTQLPISLLMAVVGCASEPGDLVIDPFSGSGTTGEASIKLGRRYLGFEQSAQFVELSRCRLIATTEDHHVSVSA